MSEALDRRSRGFAGIVTMALAASPCRIGACAPSRTAAPTLQPEVMIHEGTLPREYRDWRMVSVAHEEGTLDDIRAVLGNDVAIEAYREAKPTFPDGTIIARLAWKYVPSETNNRIFGRPQSFVAGPPVNGVQFMVKDSKKYAATGGWEFSQFDDGKPLVDKAALKSCFDCHVLLTDGDLVFTHYAP